MALTLIGDQHYFVALLSELLESPGNLWIEDPGKSSDNGVAKIKCGDLGSFSQILFRNPVTDNRCFQLAVSLLVFYGP